MRRIPLGLVLAFALASGQWLEAVIPLPSGSFPWGLCYNSHDNKVYCSDSDSDTVTVIDGAENASGTTRNRTRCIAWTDMARS